KYRDTFLGLGHLEEQVKQSELCFNALHTIATGRLEFQRTLLFKGNGKPDRVIKSACKAGEFVLRRGWTIKEALEQTQLGLLEKETEWSKAEAAKATEKRE